MRSPSDSDYGERQIGYSVAQRFRAILERRSWCGVTHIPEWIVHRCGLWSPCGAGKLVISDQAGVLR